jgi:U4/U6 small nuclear ribonucleoprotein PRP31
MSALADELTADFADLDDEEDQEYDIDDDNVALDNRHENGKDADGDEDMSDAEREVTDGPNKLDERGVMPGGVQPAEQLDPSAVQRMELGGVADVSKVAKLYGSRKMNDIIKVISTERKQRMTLTLDFRTGN